MRQLLAITACSVGLLTFGAGQSEACFFGCFSGLHQPTSCGYGPTTSYYAPTSSYYGPTTSYYAPVSAYYAPATSYYAPSCAPACGSCNSGCSTNSCNYGCSTNNCNYGCSTGCNSGCSTGSCGDGCSSGSCGSGCASGNCGVTQNPNVDSPMKTAAQPRRNIRVETPKVANMPRRQIVNSATNLQPVSHRTAAQPAPSTGWEPIPTTR